MRYFSILALSTLLLSACTTLDSYKASRVQMQQNFTEIQNINPDGDAFDLEKAIYFMDQYSKAEVEATSAAQTIAQSYSQISAEQKEELGKTFTNADYQVVVRELSTFTFYLGYASQACDVAKISSCGKLGQIKSNHQESASSLINNYRVILGLR